MVTGIAYSHHCVSSCAVSIKDYWVLRVGELLSVFLLEGLLVLVHTMFFAKISRCFMKFWESMPVGVEEVWNKTIPIDILGRTSTLLRRLGQFHCTALLHNGNAFVCLNIVLILQVNLKIWRNRTVVCCKGCAAAYMAWRSCLSFSRVISDCLSKKLRMLPFNYSSAEIITSVAFMHCTSIVYIKNEFVNTVHKPMRKFIA